MIIITPYTMETPVSDMDKYGVLSALTIFVTLCGFNVPFAFVYTTMFMYFYSIKDTKYDMFYNFILTSISVVGYVLILSGTLTLIEYFGGIPRDERFPLFYQL
jgi:hypothetical protein